MMMFMTIGERLKLEGDTENAGVWTKKRKGMTAVVLMATPCIKSLGGGRGGRKQGGGEGRKLCWKFAKERERERTMVCIKIKWFVLKYRDATQTRGVAIEVTVRDDRRQEGVTQAWSRVALTMYINLCLCPLRCLKIPRG